MNVVGLMSGTSADGVDAALVTIARRKAGLHIEMLRFIRFPILVRCSNEFSRHRFPERWRIFATSMRS